MNIILINKERYSVKRKDKNIKSLKSPKKGKLNILIITNINTIERKKMFDKKIAKRMIAAPMEAGITEEDIREFAVLQGGYSGLYPGCPYTDRLCRIQPEDSQICQPGRPEGDLLYIPESMGMEQETCIYDPRACGQNVCDPSI